MDKHKAKAYMLRHRIRMRRLIYYFFSFVLCMIPGLIALFFGLMEVGLHEAAIVFITIGTILATWSLWYVSVIMPLERYRTKLREKKTGTTRSK